MRTITHSTVVVALCCALQAVSVHAGDDPSDFSPSDFPGSVYNLDAATLAGAVNVENLPGTQSANWTKSSVVRCSRGSFFGGKYNVWAGPAFTGVHPDANHTRQGSKNDWLVFKFMVPQGQAGLYKMIVHKCHLLHDGDNDCWIGYIGMPSSVPIGRYGWASADSWNWGNKTMEDNRDGFNLQEGLNAVYVGGRSKGFACSRIAVYKATGGDGAAIDDRTTPESTVFGSTGINHGLHPALLVDAVPIEAPAMTHRDVYDIAGRRVAGSTMKLSGTAPHAVVLPGANGVFVAGSGTQR